MSKFNKLVKLVEQGDEYDSNDHWNGEISVWFENGNKSHKVTYSKDTGEPVAIQRLGTRRVFFGS